MADVEFHEEQSRIAAAPRMAPRGITGYLVRQGIVKDERQASSYLLIVALLCIVAAAAIFLLSTKTQGSLSEEERRQIEGRPGAR